MEKNDQIPENYQTVMPYLIIRDALNFMNFTKSVFNAKETHKAMRDEQTIMHAEIMIGESTIMFADSTDEHGTSNAALFVYVDDADEAYQKAIDNNSTVITPLSDQGYGRSGGVKDPFGNIWWITSIPK